MSTAPRATVAAPRDDGGNDAAAIEAVFGGAHAVVANDDRPRPGPRRRDPVETFWSKVDRSSECWLWTAGVDKDGYGKFAVTLPRGSRPKQRHVRAHHFSYEQAHGVTSKGLVLMHACDTRRCVRPEHLRVGTQTENIADRDAKGRTARGKRSGAYTKPERVRRGASHGNAKLSEADVRDIRALRAAGSPIAEIARQFSVSRGHISFVVTGRGWKHVTAANENAEARDAIG